MQSGYLVHSVAQEPMGSFVAEATKHAALAGSGCTRSRTKVDARCARLSRVEPKIERYSSGARLTMRTHRTKSFHLLAAGGATVMSRDIMDK